MRYFTLGANADLLVKESDGDGIQNYQKVWYRFRESSPRLVTTWDYLQKPGAVNAFTNTDQRVRYPSFALTLANLLFGLSGSQAEMEVRPKEVASVNHFLFSDKGKFGTDIQADSYDVQSYGYIQGTYGVLKEGWNRDSRMKNFSYGAHTEESMINDLKTSERSIVPIVFQFDAGLFPDTGDGKGRYVIIIPQVAFKAAQRDANNMPIGKPVFDPLDEYSRINRFYIVHLNYRVGDFSFPRIDFDPKTGIIIPLRPGPAMRMDGSPIGVLPPGLPKPVTPIPVTTTPPTPVVPKPTIPVAVPEVFKNPKPPIPTIPASVGTRPRMPVDYTGYDVSRETFNDESVMRWGNIVLYKKRMTAPLRYEDFNLPGLAMTLAYFLFPGKAIAIEPGNRSPNQHFDEGYKLYPVEQGGSIRNPYVDKLLRDYKLGPKVGIAKVILPWPGGIEVSLEPMSRWEPLNFDEGGLNGQGFIWLRFHNPNQLYIPYPFHPVHISERQAPARETLPSLLPVNKQPDNVGVYGLDHPQDDMDKLKYVALVLGLTAGYITASFRLEKND